MRRGWLALAVGVLLPVLAGCQTDRRGVRVNLTSAVRLYREHANRRPSRAQVQAMVAQLPPEQLNDLGVLYEREGRLDDAVWAYQHAIWASPLSPTSSRAYVNLGNVRRQQGDAAEARKRYRQALSIDPGNFTAANNLGDVCASERVEVEDAIGRLSPLVAEPGPFRAYGLDTLGWLYHAKGDEGRARETLEAARQAAEEGDAALLSTVHGHLAEVCRACGEEAEAAQHAAEAARLQAATKTETR